MSSIWIPKWIFGFIRAGVKDLSTVPSLWIPKWIFGLFVLGGGGGGRGAKCVEVLCIEGGEGARGAKCVEVLCIKIFTN